MPRLPAGEQVVHDAGALGLGQELRAEPDQPARRDPELQPDAAAAVVDHLGHRAAPHADLRDDHALELLGDVDDQILDRLHHLAVDLLRHDVGARDLQLEAFAPHHLDQDRQLQLAAAEHLHLLGRVGRLDPDRHVAEQLAFEPILDLARGDELAVASRHRRRVDAEDHRHRRLVDGDRRHRHRILDVGDRFADRDVLDAGETDDVAGGGFVDVDALAAPRTRTAW